MDSRLRLILPLLLATMTFGCDSGAQNKQVEELKQKAGPNYEMQMVDDESGATDSSPP